MSAQLREVDLIAEDRDERPVLLVAIKPARAVEGALEEFLDDLEGAPASYAFGMFVEPDLIRVYRRGDRDPVARIDPSEVVRHYSADGTDDGLRRKRQFGIFNHLQTILGAWIRDLAYRWKPGSPPALDTIADIGLLPLIEGGRSREGVSIDGRPVC